MPTKKKDQLGPTLEEYYIHRLQNAMKNDTPLAPAELNSIIKAHESGVMGLIPQHEGGAGNSPPGEMNPTANIDFKSPWMRGPDGQIVQQPATNGRANGTAG